MVKLDEIGELWMMGFQPELENARLVLVSSVGKQKPFWPLRCFEVWRRQVWPVKVEPIPNQTCHCHVVTGARVSRPECQTKCQTSLVTEAMLEDAACWCTNTSYVCSLRVRSAPGGQTLHQGDSLSHNRDASARQNLFVCWKAVLDKMRFLLCDVFMVLRLGHTKQFH